jgi:hypothetical protein
VRFTSCSFAFVAGISCLYSPPPAPPKGGESCRDLSLLTPHFSLLTPNS